MPAVFDEDAERFKDLGPQPHGVPILKKESLPDIQAKTPELVYIVDLLRHHHSRKIPGILQTC
jgi:hypothetical protein